MFKATLLERAIGEVLGTFLLVFIGCGSASVAGMLLHNGVLRGQLAPADLVLVALGFGLALLVTVMVVGRVSGAHVNPAVTIGLAATGRFP